MPISALVSALTFTLCLTATTGLPQQNPTSPSRDTAQVASAGTAIIRGRVTDRETGQPLGRVMVTLTSAAWLDEELSASMMMTQAAAFDYSSVKRNEPRTTITAADGRFEFRKILPGAYFVSFDAAMIRGTHLDQRFGELTPRDQLKPGRRVPPIDLRDGETRENVDVALWRALAIDGRVVDDAGEPVANANVNITPWDAPSFMYFGKRRDTDDRGMFRLFGLAPGHYRICATAEQHFGASGEATDKIIRTCYPSAINDGDAQPFILSAREAASVEIRLQRNRTYKITGIAIDASGVPISNADVNLEAIRPSGSSASNIEVKSNGQFIASGVTPGKYAIHVRTGGTRLTNRDESDFEQGYVPVRVDTTDVDGVVVATSKSARVAGRIIFEGETTEPPTRNLSVTTTPDELTEGGHMYFGRSGPTPVRDDMSFELTGVFGPALLMVMGAPRGWIVKSVKYLGDDVTDRAVEFKSSGDPRLLEVTLTNQGAMVTGRVLGDDDKESSDASIVLLPADLSRWRPFPGSPVKSTRLDGTFNIGPVRAGEYIVAAVTGVSTTNLLEPSARAEFAERIAKDGDRIILVENEKRSIDLRVVKLQ